MLEMHHVFRCFIIGNWRRYDGSHHKETVSCTIIWFVHTSVGHETAFCALNGIAHDVLVMGWKMTVRRSLGNQLTDWWWNVAKHVNVTSLVMRRSCTVNGFTRTWTEELFLCTKQSHEELAACTSIGESPRGKSLSALSFSFIRFSNQRNEASGRRLSLARPNHT